MKIVKVISKTGDKKMQVITDEGTTKHIQKVGSKWMAFIGNKVNEHGDISKVFKPIEGGSNEG
jgi:hypothetical protein